MLPRRAFLAAALLPVLPAVPAADPSAASSLAFFAAVVRAKSADAAFRASGLVSVRTLGRAPASPEWRAYRVAQRAERYAARRDLEAMTPATEAEARALVKYYAARVEMAGTAGAARRCRRRLREILSRPDACQPGCDLPVALAPRDHGVKPPLPS